jgi:hypothetical protein
MEINKVTSKQFFSVHVSTIQKNKMEADLLFMVTPTEIELKFLLPVTQLTSPSNSVNTDSNVNRGDFDNDHGIQPEKQSLFPDTPFDAYKDDKPKDNPLDRRGASKAFESNDEAEASKDAEDDCNGGVLELNPAVKCSSQNKHPIDRKLSCVSLVKDSYLDSCLDSCLDLSFTATTILSSRKM